MNMTDTILEQAVYAIHYVEMDVYTGKKLRSYTGKEFFSTIEHVNKFLAKNGYKPYESVKFDYEMKVGSLTTYVVMKQFELYSY